MVDIIHTSAIAKLSSLLANCQPVGKYLTEMGSSTNITDAVLGPPTHSSNTHANLDMVSHPP